MTNEIQKIREATERGLATARLSPGGPHTELSPCGSYRLDIEEYEYDEERGTDFAVAVVRRTADNHEIATVKRNDSRCFYGWVSRGECDYLLFPEDLEGQTVVDLTTGQIVGFSSPDDPFIWAQFYPSPDGTRLAVVGCYWACPYQVTVYDFRKPLNLPLPKLSEFVLPENDAEFGEWIGNSAFQMQSKSGAGRVFEIPQEHPAESAVGSGPAR